MEPASTTDPVAIYEQAISLHQSGKLVEAETLYTRLLAQFPGNPLVLTGLGIIALQRGQIPEGIEKLERSLKIEPAQPSAHQNLGLALRTVNRLEEALACFDRAIAAAADNADAHDYRGIVLQDLRRLEEALASHERAIALAPHRDSGFNNRGAVLLELNRPEEALESLDQAIRLNPHSADAYCNRGNALRILGRLDQALASCDRALDLRPDHARAHINRGAVCEELMRLDDAQACFDRATELEPNDVLARWHSCTMKLLNGDFDEGWRLFEWRWKMPAQKDAVRKFSQELWLGDSPLSGKTLLIHPEQGLGDTIQFCRYATLANALGAKVILEAPQPLVALVSTLKGDITVIEKGKPLPPFDLHCPIMSLPLAFKTTIADIPSPIPYLYPSAEKQQEWRHRLGHRTKLRVGLAWSGAAGHLNDRNRSIPLHLFKPLLQLPAEYHSLQREIRPGDAAMLPELLQLRLHDAELRDFSDTAALVNEMDLVISVDTSIAHLAGALGKPLWILLPLLPDYRWMLNRLDTPWYPTATLFRQDARGDWMPVINKVISQIQSHYGVAKH